MNEIRVSAIEMRDETTTLGQYRINQSWDSLGEYRLIKEEKNSERDV